MRIWNHQEEGFSRAVESLVDRLDFDLQAQDSAVRKILEDIKENGDSALLKYTKQFDQTDYELKDLEVSGKEVKEAYDQVTANELKALKTAARNILRYHERQKQTSWEYQENGVGLGQMIRPLQRVGVYVPGGKASYPSSVLMNSIPAMVAGVEEIIMVSPTPQWEQRPHCLVAADLAGVTRIFKVGGAQAVAALAFGTDTIPKVDKIVGPGNIYVALAKRLVFGLVDIDMIAGPSEILVVADETAHPNFVAADLLSQAEHDEEAVPVLITPSKDLAESVQTELDRQKKQLHRQSIINVSLQEKCQVFVVASLGAAMDLANRIAPEHLELAVKEPEKWVQTINNAGSVFMGHFTPEAIGDYLAGPNHVLPTSGTARFSSPLGVYDFIKRTNIIRYTRESLKKAAKDCCSLAEMESLDAHAQAIRIRVG